jgi:GT2 family glycosyltransferase
MPGPPENPSIPVVIATRDRGGAIVGALRSILACRPAPRKIWVFDQSRDNRTAEAMAAFSGESRVRYLRSRTVGQSRAHNLAIARVQAELIAITDDDCEVPVDWLARIDAAFALDTRIAAVFGNVAAADHDSREGFVPAYSRTAPFLAKEPRDKWQLEGMGACMAIRRSVWESLGGFDEMLGPGAHYPAAGEGDFVLRALRAGWWIYETPDIHVVHHGFRSTVESRALLAGYARGTGAMMAKHIRCGSPDARRLLAQMAWRWIRRRRPEAVGLGSDFAGVTRLQNFTRGFLSGARAPLDRERWLYRDSHAAQEVE